MSYINENTMNYVDPKLGDRVEVICDYFFGRDSRNEPYVKLATRNPDSENGNYSQNLRISKRAFLKLIADMINKDYLEIADIEAYMQEMNQANL